MFKLNKEMAIVVPSTVNVNENVNNNDTVKFFGSLFSDLFGGASAENLTGFWKSEETGLVIEHPIKVYANCTESQMEKYADYFRVYAVALARAMSQDCVMIEIDGIAEFWYKEDSQYVSMDAKNREELTAENLLPNVSINNNLTEMIKEVSREISG